jgi:hypothetical protein
LHEYGYEQGKLWKKRWNNKEMLLNINMQTECLKKGGCFDIDWKSVVNDNLLTMNVPNEG